MIRKLNYTKRKKIFVKDVSIGTSRESANLYKATVSLSLEDYTELPKDAVVVAEAYTRTKVERFEMGKVEDAEDGVLLKSHTLRSFTDTEFECVHFRVKIIDRSGKNGRIIAAADRLPRKSNPDSLDNRKSILGVEYTDLGDRIWELDIQGSLDSIPYIYVNNNLPNPESFAKNNEMFISLIMPEVVNRVLSHILDVDAEEDFNELDDPDDWRYLWLCYAKNLNPEELPAKNDEDGIRNYIDDCVKSFCTKHKVLKKTCSIIEGEQE